MKTQWIVLALAAVLTALPVEAQRRSPYYSSNAFRVHLGLFTPDGESAYWEDKQLDFSGKPDDFEDILFAADYIRRLNNRLALSISSSYFQGEADQSYLDFVDDAGSPITHRTNIEIFTLSAGLMLYLANPDAAVVPYLGAGGGLYSWTLLEAGEFIDFVPPPPIIVRDRFYAEGDALGYHALAGLSVPLSPEWSIFGEARWDWADDELSDDFQGFGTLDLSGRRITGGFSWTF
jgi:hypothetical protein